jgi:hypothetical protein
MGLWSNVLDYDAIDKYLFEDYRQLHPEVTPIAPIMTIGTPSIPTKFSFCAMNFAFHRDMLPAAYQMPMDREIARAIPSGASTTSGPATSFSHSSTSGGVDVIGTGKPSSNT